MSVAVEQWGTYWADLDPAVGSEQGGERRPVLVVSNNGFNAQFQVVTVVPLTKAEDKQRRMYPFEVLLPRGMAGNPLESIAMPQQIRTISKYRMREPLGFLDDADLRRAIEDAIMDHLGIALDEEVE